jgi:hypothetical protein
MPYAAGALLRTLFDSSLRALAITAGIAGTLALLKVRSSAARHAAWTAVLFAMILMPVLPSIVPSFSLPIEGLPPVSIYTDRPEIQPADWIPASPASTAETPLTTPTRPRQEPIQSLDWPMILAIVYTFGVLAGLSRFAAGWLVMHRFGRFLSPTRFTRLGRVFESEFAKAPMTMGLLRPRIILPADWRSWPADKLRAVFAHEAAHIRRKDPLVRCIARLNCCFFWFHPLAWWLERCVNAAAEEACDDAAIRVTRDPRRYAAVLLDIAESVRRGGARLAWQFVGADGSLIEQRIDRIVSSAFIPHMSWRRKAIVALASAAIIAAVAACAQPAKPSLESELKALAKVEEARHERESRSQSDGLKFSRITGLSGDVRNLTPEQASDLENYLRKNPDDFNTRYQLILYYYNQRPKTPAEISKVIAARREHLRAFVRSYPNDPLNSTPYAFINTQPPDVLADPAGYAEIRALWIEQANRPDASPLVLENAAYFMQLDDMPMAEQFLKRAEKPGFRRSMAAALGTTYAEAILGATSITPPFNGYWGNLIVLGASAEKAHSAQAEEVRKTLAASNDAEVLLTVARIIGRPIVMKGIKPDYNAVALGKSYLERAAVLNPDSEAVIELARIRNSAHERRLTELPKENRVEAALKLSDRDRFELLGYLAKNSYAYGNAFPATQRDDALREWEKARKYAAGLLETAGKFRKDPDYGNAVFEGNTMLSFIASQHGDTNGALQYLRDATKSSGTSEWENPYGFDPWVRVCNLMIDKGHASEIVDFLERFAQIDNRGRDDLLAAAAQVRSGMRPRSYRGGQ